MTELTKEQLEEGKKVLEGPRIYFWVLAIIAGIGILSQNSIDLLSKGINFGWVSIGIPGTNSIWVFAALYVAGLIGLHMRKSWAVPVGRAGLVVSMVVLFPVGTIFGAILWKRFNDPAAKRYLNYKTNEPIATTAPSAASADPASAASAMPQTTPGNTIVNAEEKPDTKPGDSAEPKPEDKN